VRVAVKLHGYAGATKQVLDKRRLGTTTDQEDRAVCLRSCQRMSGEVIAQEL
jgi:hypothetical protein